jgi:hypothetical protein
MASDFNTSTAKNLLEEIERTQSAMHSINRTICKLQERGTAKVNLQFYFCGAPNSYDAFSISNKAIMMRLAVDEQERLASALKLFTRELGELVDEVGCGK